MLARISLMFVVAAGLCAGAFSIGGAAAQADASGIPQEHPIALALRFHQELGLDADQMAKVEGLRAAMAKEFAPLRERAESLQRQMQEFQKNGNQDPSAGAAVQHEGEQLGQSIKPLFERYAHSLGELLSQEQKEKLMHFSQAQSKDGDPRGFVLMFLMQAREQLGVTPQQFTKLQYLQSDFIRAFAPLREQSEMMGMEAQEKFGKAGKEPDADFQARMQALQKKVKDLQDQFSERAVKDVLQPNQRAMLTEMLSGEHHPGQPGQ